MENRSIPFTPKTVPILDAFSAYETCRIQISDSEKRLFAIQFDGDYYRLVRARKSREKALDIAARLQEQGHEVIITQSDGNHGVWVLESEAVLSPV